MKKGKSFSLTRSVDLRNLPPTSSVNKLKTDSVYCLKFLKIGERRCVVVGMRDQIVLVDYPSGTIRNVIRGYSRNEFVAYVIRIEHFREKSTNEVVLYAQSTDGVIYSIRNLFDRKMVLYKITKYYYCRKGFCGIRTLCKISSEEFVSVARNETSERDPFRNALRNNIRIHNVNETSRSLSVGRVHSKDVKCLSYWETKNILLIAFVIHDKRRRNLKRGSLMVFDLTDMKLRNHGRERYLTPGIIYVTKGISTETGGELLITISKVSKPESEIIVWNFESSERICSFPLDANCYPLLLTSNEMSNYIVSGDKKGRIKLFFLPGDCDSKYDGGRSSVSSHEDVYNYNCEKTEKFHERGIHDMIWINEERGIFCTASADGSIKFVSTSITSGHFDENERIDFLLGSEDVMDGRCEVLEIIVASKPFIIVSKLFYVLM